MDETAPPPMTEPSGPAATETTVPVRLGARSYEVRVVSGGSSGLGPFARAALDATWGGRSSRRALVVTDENVEPLAGPYLEALEAAGMATTVEVLPPGEASKSLDRAADLAAAAPYPNPRPLDRDALRALLQRAFDGAPPLAD